MASEKIHRKRAAAKHGSLFDRAVDQQMGISLCVLAAIGSAYALDLPYAKNFVKLSYRRSHGQYDRGINDIFYVVFYVFVFTFLRAFVMDIILKPFASKVCKIRNRGKITRFAEQGYSFLYYCVYWSLGVYIMSGKPYWFHTPGFWIGYPHKMLDGLDKWYYLSQFAFWVQQIFAINAEKRRKDYVEMFAHHIVTNLLIGTSYIANFTYIGNAVLVMMDFVDVLLPLAKMLRYAGFSTICDVLFGFFVLCWIYSRHYVFLIVMKSIWLEGPELAPFKWDPENGYYWNAHAQKFFLVLFGLLQTIMIFWLAMIFKVILRVLKGNNADDNRSDSDESEDEKMAADKKKPTKKIN